MTQSIGHSAVADKLVGKLYAVCILAAAGLCLALLEADVAISRAQPFANFIFDPSGYALGRDFLNTWIGGRSAFSGGPAAWFDFATYNAVLQQITGRADYPVHFWSYPPHLLLFTWPLALLPYLPAYALWCVGGLALYLLAAFAGGADRRHILLLALAPAVAVNVFYGQNGFLTAALLIGGLANLDRRPILAGILFGILTIKPQIGLLLPVLLLVTGRWLVITAAVATTAALAAAASVWFGPDIWPEFFRKVMPQQHRLMIEAGELGWTMVSSTFVQARLIGLPVDAAWAMQGASSCCALATVIWTYWRPRDPVLSPALFVTATFLFSPWMTSYDMVVFGWVVALLRERSDNSVADHGLAIALWMLPAAMLPFGAARIPIAVLVLAAFAGRLVWRLYCAKTRRMVAGAPSAAVSPAA